MAANPLHKSDSSVFCCVHILSQYIRHADLKVGYPLFSFKGKHLSTHELTIVMKACAVHFDFDPTRVVPACLRKNVITQMELKTPGLLRQLQGGWKSNTGETNYWCKLLQVADENQHAVHHTGSATVDVIRNIFSAVSTLPGFQTLHQSD